jgi:hypothetical protein
MNLRSGVFAGGVNYTEPAMKLRSGVRAGTSHHG